jgi:hypothetical protein
MVYVIARQPPSLAARLRQLLLYAFAALLLVGVAWLAVTVRQAIDDHHDRIALKGFNGKPSPVALTVGSEELVIPANLIRFPADRRRGGQVTAVDLLLLWPSLDGFSEERAKDFRDASAHAPLLYVTITEAETPLDATTRLHDLYALYFQGDEFPGPNNLAGRHMDPKSAYRGEVVYYGRSGSEPYVVRCLAEETEEIPATCLREVSIGNGLTMLYRFNRTWLGDWNTMDDRLRRLVNQFHRGS